MSTHLGLRDKAGLQLGLDIQLGRCPLGTGCLHAMQPSIAHQNRNQLGKRADSAQVKVGA